VTHGRQRQIAPEPSIVGFEVLALSYQNQAVWDRLLHIGVGLVMLLAGWWLLPDGLWGAALRVFGIIPLITGLIGWSPFYALFGWSSRSQDRRPPV
jgi:hypothetical protein